MTQTGTVLGTSDYIAPEQAQGRRVDEHSDVYSLGVVLYELLTSKVPFPGENFVAVAMRHINEPPPSVRVERPDVSCGSMPHCKLQWRRSRAIAGRRCRRSVQELEACLAELSPTGTGRRSSRRRGRGVTGSALPGR